jgi:hypothetical protein
MKKILLIAAVIAAFGITVLIVINGPEQESLPVQDPARAAQVRKQKVVQPNSSLPSQPQGPVTSPPPPASDPREQWLDTLYESPSIAERLAAARQIAARNDEQGMSDLATFISAAEENGEASLLALAGQLADILGQMHGPGVEAIATELAYSPSALVAEAAVNAAVKTQPVQAPQHFALGTGQLPADQNALDGYVQKMRQEEMQAEPQAHAK